MTDSSFRSFRRGANARDSKAASQDLDSDPLAELARLIGQSEEHGGRDFRQPADAFADNAGAALEWTADDDDYAPDNRETDRTYASSPSAESYRSNPAEDFGGWPVNTDDADERFSPPQYFRPPRPLDDLHADGRRDGRPHEDHYRDAAQSSHPQAPPYIAPNSRDYAEGEAPSEPDDQIQNEYEGGAAAPRLNATVVTIAVLGLAVLGSAAALGYHAMFGGSIIPSLPPIIKPGNTPVKIVPKQDAQAGTPNQAGGGAKATEDRLVSHEEKPVEVQTANPPPRVVTTIPVIPNAPDVHLSNAQQPATSLPSPPPVAPPPASVPPTGTATPAQPLAAANQLVSAEPPSGSKPVRTVIIRPDQPPSASPATKMPATATHPLAAHQTATNPTREAAPRTAAAGPLSIVPDQSAPEPSGAQRAHTATARPSGPMSLASPSPATGVERGERTASAGAGGYAVQVSSQRSEAEATAAFRALQAKYPQQLGDRQAIVRRADLGSKGVYYRALVGPFASAEQAANLCSKLKAAGASCLIQRN